MDFTKPIKFLSIVFLFLASCNKLDLSWELHKYPEVKTNAISSLTDVSASAGGDISKDGGASILERGICYSKNPNPSYKDLIVKSGTGKGIFLSNLNNLTPKTTYYLRAYATNKVGTAYGQEVNFTTKGIASISTNLVTSITLTSAQSGGNISSDGGSTITERGICYAITENPTVTNTKIKSGSGIGNYLVSLTNLTSNTQYFVRAYAINSIGIAYGSQVSFTTSSLPTLTTNQITSITQVTAVTGGNITNSGSSSVTTRGVCYNTLPNPTISNAKVTGGSGLGSFTTNLSGLLPNTTYYVRAYATTILGTAYGNEIVFTTITIAIPELATTTVSSITATTAISGGNITSDGGSTVSSRGICYLTSPNPTISNNVVASGNGLGLFISNLTGLIPETTYYIRAYATNSVGTAYGNEIIFTTNQIVIPTLTTSNITSITAGTAISGGNITSDGGSSVISRGVCWSINQNPTILDNLTDNGTGTGIFTSSLSGILPNTTYYVRAYASNSAGTAYGNEVNFKSSAVTIGQSFAGGTIFYVDVSGQHGLIASTTNQTSSVWGCSGTSIVGCSATSIGTGQSNTTAIVNGCSTTGIAARICNDLVLNGYSDWYLPSKDELNLMYQQRSLIGLFSSGYYWSSTQNSGTSSLSLSFSTGVFINGIKTNSYYVRAIRSF
jgi:hypothetical protein